MYWENHAVDHKDGGINPTIRGPCKWHEHIYCVFVDHIIEDVYFIIAEVYFFL